MTDVAFMQSFLRREEISKNQENNEQENFYRYAGGGGGYKEKFVQGETFCTDRFMSSSRGENQRTFLQDEGKEKFFYTINSNISYKVFSSSNQGNFPLRLLIEKVTLEGNCYKHQSFIL